MTNPDELRFILMFENLEDTIDLLDEMSCIDSLNLKWKKIINILRNEMYEEWLKTQKQS